MKLSASALLPKREGEQPSVTEPSSGRSLGFGKGAFLVTQLSYKLSLSGTVHFLSFGCEPVNLT